MLLLPRAPYPSPSCVAVDVTRQLAQNTDYQHLQEPDLLWTGAILSNRAQKDHQNRPLRDRDFLLDSMIEVGLYDNEAANTFLEKLMRYTAVNSSLLYDHIVALENKVIHRLASALSVRARFSDPPFQLYFHQLHTRSTHIPLPHNLCPHQDQEKTMSSTAKNAILLQNQAANKVYESTLFPSKSKSSPSSTPYPTSTTSSTRLATSSS